MSSIAALPWVVAANMKASPFPSPLRSTFSCKGVSESVPIAMGPHNYLLQTIANLDIYTELIPEVLSFTEKQQQTGIFKLPKDTAIEICIVTTLLCYTNIQS